MATQACLDPGCHGSLVFDAEELHDVCQACGRVVDVAGDLQTNPWGGSFVPGGDDGAAAGVFLILFSAWPHSPFQG